MFIRNVPKSREKMKISFTKLAGEECSKCSAQLQHSADAHGKQEVEPRHHEEACEKCRGHQKHLDDAREARQGYRADADNTWETGTVIISADMMKVYMLPQLPIKDALFTPRLSCYNETFTPLMPSTKENKQLHKEDRAKYSACVLWHEGAAGRGGEEVAASFYLYLTTVCRDVEHVVIWLDNCASQNKSWVLMSTLIKAVHSAETLTETITLKFFEPGHTSMAADAVHQAISKNLRRRDRVEDFKDFETATTQAGPTVIVMEPGINMVATEDGISRHALKLLADEAQRPRLAAFKVVKVRRGSEELLTKNAITQADWVAYNITKATFDPLEPLLQKDHSTSTDLLRVDGIVSKLVPHLSTHKRGFWTALQNAMKERRNQQGKRQHEESRKSGKKSSSE